MSWSWYRLPRLEKKPKSQRVDSARFQYLLCVQTTVFGIQVGFKLYSRTAIFLLNVCHMLTMVQIYILTKPNRVLARHLFRLQIFWLIGEIGAILTKIFWLLLSRTRLCCHLPRHGVPGDPRGESNILAAARAPAPRASLSGARPGSQVLTLLWLVDTKQFSSLIGWYKTILFSDWLTHNINQFWLVWSILIWLVYIKEC